MLTFEERQRLTRIINALLIPESIKQNVIKNLDNIDKNQLLDIIKKYISNIKAIKGNKGKDEKQLLQSQNAYSIYKDEKKHRIDADRLLDLI